MNTNFSHFGNEHFNVQLPTRCTEFSAGYDLYLPKPIRLEPGEQALIPLGIKWNPDRHLGILGISEMNGWPVGGIFAKIFDKSGLAYKARFNTRAGVIDQDYIGKEWGLICVNESAEWFYKDAGQSIAQFVLLPFLVAADLFTKDSKRVGGYGSTG